MSKENTQTAAAVSVDLSKLDFSKGWNEENAAAVVAVYTELLESGKPTGEAVAKIALETELTVAAVRGKLVSLKVYQSAEKAPTGKRTRTSKAEIVRDIKAALEGLSNAEIDFDTIASLDKANAAALKVVAGSLYTVIEHAKRAKRA